MSTAKLLIIIIPISIAFGAMVPLTASAIIRKKRNWIKASYMMAAFCGLAIGWFLGGTML